MRCLVAVGARRRRAAAAALACLVLAAAGASAALASRTAAGAAAAAGAPRAGLGPGPTRGPRALVAFLPTARPPAAVLDRLAARPPLAIGLTSPTLGGYSPEQAVLDMSQGTRVSSQLYDGPPGPLRLVPARGGGRIAGWLGAVDRARGAPGSVVPGLLAETIRRRAGRTAYAGVAGSPGLEAVVAADASGRVPLVSLGPARTVADRALSLWRRAQLVVVGLPAGDPGLVALDRLLAARRAPDLLYVVEAPPPGPALRLLPSGAAGPGLAGVLRSPTTRLDGLVAGTDVAPTVLRRLGIPVPAAMQGQPLASRPGDGARLAAALGDRLATVRPRRVHAVAGTLGAIALLIAGLAAARGRAGLRTGLRTGFLAVLWLPGLTLVTAALEPSAAVEALVIVIGSLGLGALTDRLVPWPRGPALAAAVVFAAHAIDLVSGSPLIARSLDGPNPEGGARFFGVGNELETLLSLTVLLGTGAAVARAAPGRAARAFAAACLVAAVVMGAGRFGADVGAVITLAAGAVGAVVASVAPVRRRRAIALGVLAPVLAVGGLVALDLATGGGAHLTRSVLDARGVGDLLDVAERRLRLSAEGVTRGVVLPVVVALAVGVLAAGFLKRDRVLAPLCGRSGAGLRAGILGSFTAVVVSALANDSGPTIVIIGAVVLLLAAGYARGGPPRPAVRRPAAAERDHAGAATGVV